MPWVRAELRGQRVYARATESGELAVEDGRVEVRYRPHDGRMYRAAARNLVIVEAQVLPDGACGPAQAVQAAASRERPAAATRGRGRGTSPPSRAAAGAPSVLPAVQAGVLPVFTDGACSSNPGPAGVGVVIDYGAERLEISEYLGRGTNNIAELTAVLRALGELSVDCSAVIHTDSKYAIGVLQQGWKAKKNGELVAATRAELARRPAVRLRYVPGHVGVPLNERADALARHAIASRGSSRERVRQDAHPGDR